MIGVKLVSGLAAVTAALWGTSALAQPTTAAATPMEQSTAPNQKTRPNVLVWMLDDVGFAQLSCFGGLVATPNIDRVAKMGLRYANYRTPAVCSASRAAFLSGRNPHTVHVGSHAAAARPATGYDAKIPASAGSIAANLRQAGYRTYALGKWDHLPTSEASPAGPYYQWPAGQGFDHFYGFLAADADNFSPILIRDTAPIKRPEGADYHLNNDLADQAIAMIGERDAVSSSPPFFMYWATGTAHAPHHAPKAWLDRYKGKFDMGWDKARESILAKQKAQGLVPQDARLAPRPESMPAWDSLTDDQKKLYARQMEAFAASLGYADEQFGRILDELEARGELNNTMVIVTADNGASAEGGPRGLYNEAFLITGGYPSDEQNMSFYEKWGGPETYPHYSFGWAVAGNTPFRYYKQVTHEGGIHVPLVVSWPRGIEADGETRNQFIHVADIAPTILEAAGVPMAEMVNNVKQQPMDGISFAYTFDAPRAPNARKAQYYEMFGNKALIAGDWSINTTYRTATWAEDSEGDLDAPWELYNLARDPGQIDDLAAKHPDRVVAMAAEFDRQATRYNVYPIMGQSEGVKYITQQVGENIRNRDGKYSYAGPVGNIPSLLAPPIGMMGFSMTADLNLPARDVTGPVFASGGHLGGIALYLRNGKPVLILNTLAGETTEFEASETLASGTTRLGLTFQSTPGATEHAVKITADGRVLAEGTISFEMPQSFGISEVFGVGIDNGSTVMPGVQADLPIAGELSNVTFQLQLPGGAPAN